MKTIYPKRIIFVVIFCSFTLLNSTCKKEISNYPFDMTGIWMGYGDGCNSKIVIVIENNGFAESFSLDTTSRACHFNPDINKGIVKYKGDKLFIGERRYWFLEKPAVPDINDSIVALNDLAYMSTGTGFSPHNEKKYKVLGRMKISGNARGRGESYYLFKYIDY